MAESQETEKSLRSVFDKAESIRKSLENAPSSNSSSFQDSLAKAISSYEQCIQIADRVSLWSANEGLEDVSSGDLQYFLIRYQLAELMLRNNREDRKKALVGARSQLKQFLKLLDSYDVLSKEDVKTFERFSERPDSFSTASTTDAAARRNTKIARFKEEKALKSKLEHLRSNPSALASDDAALRELHLTHIALCIHTAFQTLESIAQELQILAMAPPASAGDSSNGAVENDVRLRRRTEEGYSERLDGPISELLANGKAGPILNKDGRPLRPFTLLDTRQRLRDGVFRPDHNLPTMTIDEYLEEERRRGGIIEGGGEASLRQPEVDEDDVVRADAETLKARHWDDYKDDNPRGAGNTMNMG